MKAFTVKSVFHGRLEIPGKKEPLFYGRTHTYTDKLPEKVMYFIGEDKLTMTESDVASKPEKQKEHVWEPAADYAVGAKPEKSSSKKSEKNS